MCEVINFKKVKQNHLYNQMNECLENYNSSGDVKWMDYYIHLQKELLRFNSFYTRKNFCEIINFSKNYLTINPFMLRIKTWINFFDFV